MQTLSQSSPPDYHADDDDDDFDNDNDNLKKNSRAKLRNTQRTSEENMRHEYHIFLITALEKDKCSAYDAVGFNLLSSNRNLGGRHRRVNP
jgi:hypothetical protein